MLHSDSIMSPCWKYHSSFNMFKIFLGAHQTELCIVSWKDLQFQNSMTVVSQPARSEQRCGVCGAVGHLGWLLRLRWAVRICGWFPSSRWQDTAATIGAVVELISHGLLGFDCPETEAFSYKQETQTFFKFQNPKTIVVSAARLVLSTWHSTDPRMADVKCTICGDRGHVASDCKQAAEQHKKARSMSCGFQSVVVIVGLRKSIAS